MELVQGYNGKALEFHCVLEVLVDGGEFGACEVSVVVGEAVGVDVVSFQYIDGFADVVVHLLESFLCLFSVSVIEILIGARVASLL